MKQFIQDDYRFESSTGKLVARCSDPAFACHGVVQISNYNAEPFKSF